MKKEWTQSLHFSSKFDLPFALNIADIENNENLLRKTFSHCNMQMWQNQDPISSTLFGKNKITFCTIYAIFSPKQSGVTSQRMRTKI